MKKSMIIVIIGIMTINIVSAQVKVTIEHEGISNSDKEKLTKKRNAIKKNYKNDKEYEADRIRASNLEIELEMRYGGFLTEIHAINKEGHKLENNKLSENRLYLCIERLTKLSTWGYYDSIGQDLATEFKHLREKLGEDPQFVFDKLKQLQEKISSQCTVKASPRARKRIYRKLMNSPQSMI